MLRLTPLVLLTCLAIGCGGPTPDPPGPEGAPDAGPADANHSADDGSGDGAGAAPANADARRADGGEREGEEGRAAAAEGMRQVHALERVSVGASRRVTSLDLGDDRVVLRRRWLISPKALRVELRDTFDLEGRLVGSALVEDADADLPRFAHGGTTYVLRRPYVDAIAVGSAPPFVDAAAIEQRVGAGKRAGTVGRWGIADASGKVVAAAVTPIVLDGQLGAVVNLELRVGHRKPAPLCVMLGPDGARTRPGRVLIADHEGQRVVLEVALDRPSRWRAPKVEVRASRQLGGSVLWKTSGQGEPVLVPGRGELALVGNGSIRLLQLADGRERKLAAEGRFVAVSARGDWIALQQKGSEREVHVVGLERGARRAVFSAKGMAREAYYSTPDGKQLLISAGEQTAIAGDIGAGTQRTLELVHPSDLRPGLGRRAYGKGDRIWQRGARDTLEAWVLDTAGGTFRFEGHRGPKACTGFARGRVALVREGKVALFELPLARVGTPLPWADARDELYLSRGHVAVLSQVAGAKPRRMSDLRYDLRVVRVGQAEPLATYRLPTSESPLPLADVQIGDRGEHVVVARHGARPALMRIQGGTMKLVRSAGAPTGMVAPRHQMILSANGRYVFVPEKGMLRMEEAASGEVVDRYELGPDPATVDTSQIPAQFGRKEAFAVLSPEYAHAPDGRHIAIVGPHGVAVYDVEQGRRVATCSAVGSPVFLDARRLALLEPTVGVKGHLPGVQQRRQRVTIWQLDE